MVNINDWKNQWDRNYLAGYDGGTSKMTAKDVLLNNPNYSRVIFGKPPFETYLYPNWRTLTKSDNVLEIGCGDGWNAIQTFNKVNRYVGTDISKVSTDLANNRFKDVSCNVRILDTTDILSLDEKFNMIFSITVFQHIPRDYTAKYIKDSYEILENGGCLFFNVLSGIQNNLECTLVEGDKTCSPNIGFDIDSITKLCKNAGFTNIKYEKQEVGSDSDGDFIPNLPYWWYWLICKK